MKAELLWRWRGWWARPEQVAPPGDWTTWVINAGRGFGKSRTGAEWVREEEQAGRATRIALVGETAKDTRDVMVEGPSGILACYPPEERPLYEPSKARVTFKSGAVATLFNATEPDQLRGPQFDCAWCDELAKWRYARETWDMLQFGLRLGDRPRQVVTTTPRPIPVLKELLRDPSTVVTRGSTFDNAMNLAPGFLAKIRRDYEGTRIGRQELHAEILDDLPGALWTRDMLDATRTRQAPELRRVVVAVDPSGTKGASDDGDEIGIVVAGLGMDDRGYVLADRTCKLSPDGWGRQAVKAFHEFQADRIVAERNFGGAMVEHVIRTIDRRVSYREVTASRGKVARAEPVAALYEQGRVSHVGGFAALEDQMCVEAGTLVETQRGQVAIQDVTADDFVMTREGFAPIRWVGYTGTATQLVEIETVSSRLRVTGCHPIFQADTGKFVDARNVLASDILLESPTWADTAHRSLGGVGGIIACHLGISATRRVGCFTERFTKRMWERFLRAVTSITSTATLDTTSREILRRLLAQSITPGMSVLGSTPSAALAMGSARFAVIEPKLLGHTKRTDSVRRDADTAPSALGSPPSSRSSMSAGSAEQQAKRSLTVRSSSATPSARTITRLRVIETCERPVYNVSVADGHLPEFYANGILTHNCSIAPEGYVGEGSPDRADALVWALTDLMLRAATPVAASGVMRFA